MDDERKDKSPLMATGHKQIGRWKESKPKNAYRALYVCWFVCVYYMYVYIGVFRRIRRWGSESHDELSAVIRVGDFKGGNDTKAKWLPYEWV